MPYPEIGCCGAVCKTCPPYKNNICRGCKIGYENNSRDINKAKCKIKVCCLRNGLETCGDCKNYSSCITIQSLYVKKGYKYKKYKETMEYIRTHGYEELLKKTVTWKLAYGRLSENK